MPSIEELDIDFKAGRIKEVRPDPDPSEEYYSTVGSSTGEFAEYYAKKENTMAKKKQPTENPLARCKKSIGAKTTSCAVIAVNPLTRQELAEVKKQNPQATAEDLAGVSKIAYDTSLDFRTSQEAQNFMNVLNAVRDRVGEEYTLLRAEEIKEERKNAKKGK